MLPIILASIEPLSKGDYFKVFLQTLHMSVPAAYLWLMWFYSFFHSYMNFWGELTYFADRRFYHDWWNAGDLSEYWRKWNFPIHSFLMRHIYFPLRRRRFNKAACLLATFCLSAIAHEYLIIGIIRRVNFIAFTIMIVNVPIMIIQDKLKHVSEVIVIYNADREPKPEQPSFLAWLHHPWTAFRNHFLLLPVQ